MGKVGKRHVEGRTRQERIAVRKRLGPLQNLTVQNRTKTRYESARQGFYSFLRMENIKLPHRREDLDALVSEYIEHLWSSGEGRAKANDTVAGLQDKDPKLRGCLPGSWGLLKTWSINEIPNRAPPLPLKVLKALVGWALFHNDLAFAVSLSIGFFCMLRTGEVLDICSNHIEMSSPSKVALISLGFTKGGKRQGAAESATLSVADALALLWKWKRKASPKKNLCPTPYQWRAKFARGLKALKLEDFGFRPYSLRRGGATHWFSHHGSLDKLLIQGRWSAPKTAKLYINEGLALLAELRIPDTNLQRFLTVYNNSTR